MLAASDLTYAELMALLLANDTSATKFGRQAAHAMAHGFYACRSYAIVYNEQTGKFAFARA